MFGLFKNRNANTPPYRVWASGVARWGAVLAAVRQARQSQQTLLLVFHFDETMDELCERLDSAGYEYSLIGRTLRPSEAGVLAAGVHVVQSSMLVNDALALPQTEIGLRMLTIEPHFVPVHDAALKKFSREVGCDPGYQHYCSLDDPVMRLFAGPGTIELLERAGLTAGDHLDSPMVSRAIGKAQSRIEKRVGPNNTTSVSGWLERMND